MQYVGKLAIYTVSNLHINMFLGQHVMENISAIMGHFYRNIDL